MPDSAAIEALTDEMTAWRQALHAHPETAFEEHRTADLVAGVLESCGLEVTRGLAGTGVAGTLRAGEGPVIGLRADMDALSIAEEGDIPHRSGVAGKMHACGHDGHVAMLLGAAKYLTGSQKLHGTIHFVFQPAEEMQGGARVMVEEGFLDRFPMDAIYGLHNWPGQPLGTLSVGSGAMMACADFFRLEVTGKSGHGAMPHFAKDPILPACEMVSALRSVATQEINAAEPVVVNVTLFQAGETDNAVPERAHLGGTVRVFSEETRKAVEAAMHRTVRGIAAAHGVEAKLDYHRGYPATVNHAPQAEVAARAAEAVFGVENVDRNPTPTTGAEDFAFFLERIPGCYVWLGTARDGDNPGLHNARYDFNDAALALGARYWIALAETALGGT